MWKKKTVIYNVETAQSENGTIKYKKKKKKGNHQIWEKNC